MQAYSVYYLFSSGQARHRIISYATLFLFVIAKFSISPSFNANDLGAHLFDNSYFVLIGVNINFFFFSMVTIYGMWQEIKLMTKQEIENARELYQQRVDISNDLHDDLGATLSSLHIYSSIAKKYVQENPIKARANLDLISTNVFTLMEKINDVIWSVSTKQSNVSLLSTRIKDCFVNIFDAAGIKCTYEIDENTELSITGLKARKLLLLFAKEAINNTIKHSGASAMRFAIQQSNGNLVMSIEDNGKGIRDLDFTKGNGLTNLKHRADQLNGHFSIETLKPNGTLVECMIPLTNISL
jgi:signal transduction histidine kinase